MRIIERRPQECHPAGDDSRRGTGIGAEPLIGDHRLLLGQACGIDSGITLGVIGPGLTGGLPATAYPAHGAVDVKDLEHGLQPGAPQRGHCLQHRRRHRPGPRLPLLVQSGQDRTNLVLGREALGAEPLPDGAVLVPRQQDHLGPLHATTGAPHLLVVAHW